MQESTSVPDWSLNAVEADVTLAEAMPMATLVDRARRAARLAADLQTVLLARAAAGRSPAREVDRLLAIPKVAELLAFTQQYVYELIRRGDLPAVRSGKYVRVSASALQAFINQDAHNAGYCVPYARSEDNHARLRRIAAQHAGESAAVVRRSGRATYRRTVRGQRVSHPDGNRAATAVDVRTDGAEA